MPRLLDVIIGSTLTRVKETAFVTPKPLKPDATVQALRREYLRSDRQRDRYKAQLKARGWEMNYRNRLTALDARGHLARQRYEKTKQQRLDKVRQLRDDALV